MEALWFSCECPLMRADNQIPISKPKMLCGASVQRACRFSSHFALTRHPADSTLCVNAVRPNIQKCFRAARNSWLIYHRERVDLNLEIVCTSYDITTKHKETKLYFWQCSLLFPLCYIWSQFQNVMNNLVKTALLINQERNGPVLQYRRSKLLFISHPESFDVRAGTESMLHNKWSHTPDICVLLWHAILLVPLTWWQEPVFWTHSGAPAWLVQPIITRARLPSLYFSICPAFQQ